MCPLLDHAPSTQRSGFPVQTPWSPLQGLNWPHTQPAEVTVWLRQEMRGICLWIEYSCSLPHCSQSGTSAPPTLSSSPLAPAGMAIHSLNLTEWTLISGHQALYGAVRMTQGQKTGEVSEIYTMNNDTSPLSPPCHRRLMTGHMP